MAHLSFKCPNCSAPLSAAEESRAVECQYCHLSVAPPWAVKPKAAPPAPRSVGRVVLVGAVGVVALGAGLGLLLGGKAAAPPPVAAPVVKAPPPRVEPVRPAAPPSPATVVLSFGEKGSNETQLTDPRELTVSSDGSFFVAEGRTGRVHRFAPDGTHSGLVVLTPDKLTKQLGVFGLGADGKGNVYVNRVGDIVVYDAKTLAVVRTIAGDYPDTYFHGGIAVDASGNVHAVADRTGDLSVVTTNAKGKVTQRRKASGKHLAIDGLGRFALTSEFGNQLDLLDAKGELLSRTGGLSRPEAVAFDGQGHVFVATRDGIVVVDLKGTVLLKLDLQAAALAVDAKDRLVTLSGDKVTVYEVKVPPQP